MRLELCQDVNEWIEQKCEKKVEESKQLQLYCAVIVVQKNKIRNCLTAFFITVASLSLLAWHYGCFGDKRQYLIDQKLNCF